MDCAERFAQLSSAKRAKVGACIVKDNRIISIGYNGMPSGWTNECENTETWNDIPHMRQEWESQGAKLHQSPHGDTWSRLRTNQKYYMQKLMLLQKWHKVTKTVKVLHYFAHMNHVWIVQN